MIQKSRPCLWSMVLRYRHPGTLPTVEAIEATASPAHVIANKLALAYPAERITVLQDGYETEVRA